MRWIRVVVAMCGTVPALWGQSGDPVVRDWAQANAVLMEAMRRLNPCSPRLATLLTQVRDTAAGLARADARSYAQFVTAARTEAEVDRKLATDAGTAFAELKPAVEAIAQERGNIVEAGDPEPALRQLRENVDARDGVLRQLESLTAAESGRWNSYYNAIEAGIRRRCTESQPGAPRTKRR